MKGGKEDMTKKVIGTVNGWYMKNPKQKVELDDIVGLVKTDEPTDSVQLQKEAQLSICEKRIIELENENEQLKQKIKKLEAQLYKVEDGVCDICNNMYLVQQGRYFVSKCKKGHDECSKMDLDYCDDFELKDGDV